MISDRQIIWPGSMPAGMIDLEAWDLLLDEIGSLLPYVPAPETSQRNRQDWIVPLLLKLREHPDLEVVREGSWANYKDQVRYRIKPGHEFRSEYIDVGILSYFRQYVDEFRTVCREHKLPPNTPCQISTKGLPDFFLFAFGPGAILTARSRERHMKPFFDATIREMHAVRELAHGLTLLFQQEIPVATIFECTPLGPLRSLFDWMTDSVVEVATHMPDDCLTGCHLCLGDLGHKAKICPRTAAPVVRIGNRIAQRWPQGIQPLEYLHLPLAAGDVAPPTSVDEMEAYCRALRGLRVPPTCQIVAGFLHEDLTEQQARTFLSTVDKFVGEARRATRGGPTPGPVRPLALAPSCGCGRRSMQATMTVLGQATALCKPVVTA